MPKAVFLASQRRFTAGAGELQLQAADFRAAVSEIRSRYPDFPEQELLNCSVAIDGELVTQPWLERLGANSELVFVARIGAG